MKKKITRPDGSVEEFEGTAEELAAFEKSIKETPAPSGKEEGKKPGQQILTDEIQRLLDQAVEEMKKGGQGLLPKIEPWPVFPNVPSPLSPWITNPALPYPWKLGTTTTDRVRMDQPCAIEEFFKNHPDVNAVGLVCNCPRCTIQCVATNGLPPYGTASTAGTAYQVH